MRGGGAFTSTSTTCCRGFDFVIRSRKVTLVVVEYHLFSDVWLYVGLSLAALLVLLSLLVLSVLVYCRKRSSAAKGGATGSDLHKFPNVTASCKNICLCVLLDPSEGAEYVTTSEVRSGGFSCKFSIIGSN